MHRSYGVLEVTAQKRPTDEEDAPRKEIELIQLMEEKKLQLIRSAHLILQGPKWPPAKKEAHEAQLDHANCQEARIGYVTYVPAGNEASPLWRKALHPRGQKSLTPAKTMAELDVTRMS